jgi:hypothetical protein
VVDKRQKSMESNKATQSLHPFKWHTPFTAPWITNCLKGNPEHSTVLLQDWSHSKWWQEISSDLIQDIKCLEETKAIAAIEELKEPWVFKRGTNGFKLSLKTTIITLNNWQELCADALLDSGCEGSCIDIDFIKNNKLDTTPLLRPLWVINADGSPNVDGPILEMVSLELRIGDHTERINLGVVNLGKHNLFLGHN